MTSAAWGPKWRLVVTSRNADAYGGSGSVRHHVVREDRWWNSWTSLPLWHRQYRDTIWLGDSLPHWRGCLLEAGVPLPPLTVFDGMQLPKSWELLP